MDMKKMMKQVQKMQADLARAQSELAGVVVEGTAGGGAVKVMLSGSGEVTEVSIDPAAIDPEDPSLLEDLVRTALNGALRAQQDAAQERLGGLSGLPGLP